LRLDLQGALGKWHLLAHFNWNDRKKPIRLKPCDFNLELRKYLVRSFWEKRVSRASTEEDLFSGEIAPHGVVLLAVRKDEYPAVYLGSDLHISQGLEIKTWALNHNDLQFVMHAGKSLAGHLDLKLDSEPKQVEVNSCSIGFTRLGDDFFRITTSADEHQSFFIEM
jgi:hypothetical protein